VESLPARTTTPTATPSGRVRGALPAHHRLVGRPISLAGLVAGACYLAWRVGASLRDAPGWLEGLTLAVEVVGFASVAVLVWALWPGPADREPVRDGATIGRTAEPVDIVVRCGDRGLPWVRATLLAARSLGRVTLLDMYDDPEVAALADEYHVDHLVVAGDDLNGLAVAVAACRSPWMLLLDAGDIPHDAIIERLLPHLTRPDVAIVQGLGASALNESAQHIAPGRHERDFEVRSLNPSLGTRGVAPFTGSGALVRVAALATVDPGTSSPAMAQAVVTASLFGDCWRIVAPGGAPVLAFDSTLQEGDAESLHAVAASAARYLVFGVDGALRSNRLSLSQRLALLACAVRPLSGLRRAVLVGVVVAVLLAGRLPFGAAPDAVVALWATWFAVSAVGLGLLSGGTLRPGDRARQPFRVLGAAWRGVLAPNGRPESPRLIVAGAFGLDHSVAPAAAVAVFSLVVALRGLSDCITHTLAPLSLDHLSYVLIVTMWLLWAALGALRMFVRRPQSRQAPRVATSLPCNLGDQPGLVADLSPLGAGVVTDVVGTLGATVWDVIIEVAIPTPDGPIMAVIPAVVRNERLDVGGVHRLGVSFGRLAPYVCDALAEYCIVRPARSVFGRSPSSRRRDPAGVQVVGDQTRRSSRVGLRAEVLVAVAAALASATTGSASTGGAIMWVVVCAAALLGLGVVAGSLLPGRPRRMEVAAGHQSSSPDLAMR
jgi:hypothetical protein